MAVVDTKYITAGSYYSVVGYVGSSLPGTVSETSGGSQDDNLDDLYSGADMNSFYSTSTTLNLYITDNSSNVTNSGWDFVKIGTASFNRTDATYTADVISGRDNWRWTVTSNPFTNGSTYAISFETTSSSTTYTLNSNIRSGNDSDVQNVTVGDSIAVTVLTAYTPSVSTLVNCSASAVVTNGGSSSSSTVFTVVPTSAGSYSAILNQPYQSRTYTLTGTAASSGGGGSGGGNYGFEQLDSAGNIVVDSREATETFQEIASGLSITLLPPNVGTSTYDWTECLGVTSQQDLDDNYVFERTDGGGWTLFVTENNHTTTYISPGTIRFAWNGECRNFAGNPTTCTAFHATTNVFTVLAIGKTL